MEPPSSEKAGPVACVRCGALFDPERSTDARVPTWAAARGDVVILMTCPNPECRVPLRVRRRSGDWIVEVFGTH